MPSVWIWVSCLLLFLVELNKVEGALVVLRNYKFPTKCLHISGSRDGDNIDMDLATCDPNDKGQLLRVDKAIETNYVYITFITGKCLGIRGDGTQQAQRVIPYTCVDNKNQKWKIHKGTYASPAGFEFKTESGGFCVTAEVNGAYIDQYGCYEQPHQFWIADEITYLLENQKKPGTCLALFDRELGLAACDKRSPYMRMSSPTDLATRGSFFMQFEYDKTQSCVEGRSTSDSAYRVVPGRCRVIDNLMWTEAHRSANGDFHLLPLPTGKCLTSEYDGRYMDQYTCCENIGCIHQRWKRIVVGSSSGLPFNTPLNQKCTKDNCCSIGGTCDLTSTSSGCCPGSYCDERSGGHCILQCGPAGLPCVGGVCCENAKCVNNVCVAPPVSTQICRKQDQTCPVGIFASLATPCCDPLSCIGEKGTSAFCAPGKCVPSANECIPGGLQCCALERCKPYRGVFACRPIREPSCGRRGVKVDGCKTGDSTRGFNCCGRMCDFIKELDFSGSSGTQKIKDYACNCSPIDHFCVTDSDCCNGACGPDYVCFK